jgi:hypothetical protein
MCGTNSYWYRWQWTENRWFQTEADGSFMVRWSLQRTQSAQQDWTDCFCVLLP